MRRRAFLRAGVAAAAGAALGTRAQGLPPPQDITPLIRGVTGGKVPEKGGIEVEIPQLAENGNSIPTRIRVTCPMSAGDYVSAIYIFAERNPRPHVATFHLGPRSGRAEISTRIRLAGTQNVTILAALSGERFRIAESQVLVTAAACLDETAG
jgi:sulfur-oxidizing protein SoxY